MATPKSRRRASTLAWSRQVFFIFLTSVSMRGLCTPAPQLTGYINLVPDLEVWTTLENKGRNLTCFHSSSVTLNGTQYPIEITLIRWHVNGTTLLPVVGHEYYVHGDSVSDSGRYTCTVSYKLTIQDGWALSTSAHFHVDLIIVSSADEFNQVLRPMFSNAQLQPPHGHLMAKSDVQLLQAQSKTFDCSASARTVDRNKTMFRISYKVYHDGTLFSTSPKVLLNPVELAHAGSWLCEAANANAYTMHQFNVTIVPRAVGSNNSSLAPRNTSSTLPPPSDSVTSKAGISRTMARPSASMPSRSSPFSTFYARTVEWGLPTSPSSTDIGLCCGALVQRVSAISAPLLILAIILTLLLVYFRRAQHRRRTYDVSDESAKGTRRSAEPSTSSLPSAKQRFPDDNAAGFTVAAGDVQHAQLDQLKSRDSCSSSINVDGCNTSITHSPEMDNPAAVYPDSVVEDSTALDLNLKSPPDEGAPIIDRGERSDVSHDDTAVETESQHVSRVNSDASGRSTLPLLPGRRVSNGSCTGAASVVTKGRFSGKSTAV
eukprot:scpid57633/ scgid9540/ 